MTGKQVPIIRTTLPYLRDEDIEFFNNYHKMLKEKNITREDVIRESLLSFGLEIDFDTLTIKRID